jgi:hypothetical protein
MPTVPSHESPVWRRRPSVAADRTLPWLPTAPSHMVAARVVADRSLPWPPSSTLAIAVHAFHWSLLSASCSATVAPEDLSSLDLSIFVFFYAWICEELHIDNNETTHLFCKELHKNTETFIMRTTIPYVCFVKNSINRQDFLIGIG